MKVKDGFLPATVIGLTMFFSSCGPTHVVASRPSDVIYERPLPPGEGYIWLNGDWYWNGGGYHWRQGYWSRPRAGRQWREGNWSNTQRGYRWNRGHWQ